MTDIYELFEEHTGRDLDKFLKKINFDNVDDFRGLAASILRATIDQPENENEFLYSVQSLLESEINCQTCIIVYDDINLAELHVMGQLPKNIEIKIKGSDD